MDMKEVTSTAYGTKTIYVQFRDEAGNVRVYASGNTLLTFADFKGNDPEAPGSGLDYGMRYPMTRLFNIGAQINF